MMKTKEQQAKEYAAEIPHYQDRRQHATDDFIAGWDAAEQWRTDGTTKNTTTAIV